MADDAGVEYKVNDKTQKWNDKPDLDRISQYTVLIDKLRNKMYNDNGSKLYL